jgi:hypothetical protein
MNDAQRLDWLERELESVLSRRTDDGSSKFRVVMASKPGLTTTYSDEYDTLREAVDEGMKRKL